MAHEPIFLDKYFKRIMDCNKKVGWLPSTMKIAEATMGQKKGNPYSVMLHFLSIPLRNISFNILKWNDFVYVRICNRRKLSLTTIVEVILKNTVTD